MIAARIEVIAGRGQGKTTVLDICVKALREAGFVVSPPLAGCGKEMVLAHKPDETQTVKVTPI